MKGRYIFLVSLALVSLAPASCIRDTREGGPGGGEEPFVIAFNPKTEGHGATRAATYDGTWAEFADFFGGAALQPQDIFTAPDPNPEEIPDGFGRKADRRISSFRVLVYHAANSNPAGQWQAGELVKKGNEYLNKYFEWTENAADLANKPPFEISVNKGTYNFVFIANENSRSPLFDVTVSGGVQSVDPRIATIDEFRKLTFLHGAGRDIHSDLDIPMTAWYPGVEVTTDGFTYYDGGTPVTITGRNSTWDVKMTRAAVRLSFGIHLGRAQYDAWVAAHPGTRPTLRIEGARNAGFMYPFAFNPAVTNTGASSYDLGMQSIAASDVQSGAGVAPGKIKVRGDGSVDLFFDRIIVPEHLPADKNEKATALKAAMRFNYGSEVVTKEITVFDPATTSWGYALPRNTWVWARADVRTDIDFELKAVPWGDVPYDGAIRQWDLHTDRSEFLFASAPGSERIEIHTSQPDGWEIAVDGAAAGWIAIPTGAPTHGDSGATTVTTIAVTSANPGPGPRTGHVILTAGKLTRIITVVQLPASGGIVDTPSPPAAMYVGAFWRASQYGERLIRVRRPAGGAMDGPWAAYVIEGADWIQLDTRPSPDGGVGGATPKTNLSHADFDAVHRVPGYETSVSGTVGAGANEGDIYFRIGLNGPYAPTEDRPARYGLILLVYTSGGTTAYQRIWVRQGEQADFVMRPGDAGGSGGSAISPANGDLRPKARKFSPYNLTAREFTYAGAAGAAGSTAAAVHIYPQQDTNNYAGDFADYPSQAGGLFKWADTEGVRAFNPSGTVSSLVWGHTSETVLDPWHENVAPLYENCPPGFRRPSDGITSTTAASAVNPVSIDHSEMFQSLFLNARGGSSASGDMGNSVWGLYADGWFDRRHTGQNSHAGANSMVAYAGRLFYNPDGYNSLFLPAAGNRHGGGNTGSYVTGGLYDTGQTGVYWSSSASFLPGGTEGRTSWALAVEHNLAARMGEWTRVNGFSIRCVRGDDHTGTFAASSNVDLNFAGLPHGETVDITSLDKDGFHLRWRVTGYEVSSDGGTTWGATTTTKPDWLYFPTEGAGGIEAVPVATGAVPVTVTSTQDAALQAVATPTGSVAAPQDLSLLYDGTPHTANSYIVNGWGYYKLPLVCGNATTGIAAAAGATLVWMDAPGLVVNVRLVDGNRYLAFDVLRESIVQGNAVVAVRNTAGDILWSWHIWVTPLVGNTLAATQYDLVRNFAGTGYNFMTHNLGRVTAGGRTYNPRQVRLVITQDAPPGVGGTATPVTRTVTIRQDPGTNNTFSLPLDTNPSWRWGRKDPVPPAGATLWTDTDAMARYLQSGATIGPDAWDADNTLAGAATLTDNNVVKSIHDPSPVGFKMPPANAWTGITQIGGNTPGNATHVFSAHPGPSGTRGFLLTAAGGGPIESNDPNDTFPVRPVEDDEPLPPPGG